MLYFLAAAPYFTTFCRETRHNRAAEAAHAVTFAFSSGFYNHFPVTGCRIRRFLCQIHHRRFLSRRGGFQAHLVLYFLCFTGRLYSSRPQAENRGYLGRLSAEKPISIFLTTFPFRVEPARSRLRQICKQWPLPQ